MAQLASLPGFSEGPQLGRVARCAPMRRFAACPQAARRRERLPDASTPEVPFCALPVMATIVVLARCSAPDRVQSAATAALAAECGSICPGVGVGDLRARDRCCTRNGTTGTWS